MKEGGSHNWCIFLITYGGWRGSVLKYKYEEKCMIIGRGHLFEMIVCIGEIIN